MYLFAFLGEIRIHARLIARISYYIVLVGWYSLSIFRYLSLISDMLVLLKSDKEMVQWQKNPYDPKTRWSKKTEWSNESMIHSYIFNFLSPCAVKILTAYFSPKSVWPYLQGVLDMQYQVSPLLNVRQEPILLLTTTGWQGISARILKANLHALSLMPLQWLCSQAPLFWTQATAQWTWCFPHYFPCL